METRTGWTTLAWKAASFAAAAVLAVVVVGGIALGSCHGQGGFCSDEFGPANREAFYSALVASVGVGPLVVLPFSRRLPLLLAAGLGGLAITAIIVVALWP